MCHIYQCWSYALDIIKFLLLLVVVVVASFFFSFFFFVGGGGIFFIYSFLMGGCFGIFSQLQQKKVKHLNEVIISIWKSNYIIVGSINYQLHERK